MTVLRLPAAVYQALRAHAEETYPAECCGALFGLPAAEGWQVHAAVRAANACAALAPNRYEIAPAELAGLARDARRRGLEIAGFYHSHPGRPAQWSATDLAEAHWIGCSYVILSVERGKAVTMQAFLLAGTLEEEKHFETQALLVEDFSIGPGASRV